MARSTPKITKGWCVSVTMILVVLTVVCLLPWRSEHFTKKINRRIRQKVTGKGSILQKVTGKGSILHKTLGRIVALPAGIKAAAVIRSRQDVEMPAGNTAWRKVAGEGSAFRVDNTAAVRFGEGQKWVVKDVQGTVPCTNAYFGSDPSPGKIKTCERRGGLGVALAAGDKAAHFRFNS